MTDDEKKTICKAIASSCMWGQGGIAAVIIDELQRKFPEGERWTEVYRRHSQEAKDEVVGFVTTREEIDRYLADGYWVTNYEPGRVSIFYPSSCGGGLFKYVIGQLAEEYGKFYDSWNYNVFQRRAADQSKESP